MPRHRFPSSIVVLGSALVAGCTEPPPPPDPSPSPEVLRELEERQAAFFGHLDGDDPDAIASHFAEDGAMHVAGRPAVEGRDAIRAFYAGMGGFLASSEAAVEHTEVAVAADLAFSTGRTRNEFRGPDGTVTYEGKFTMVWRRVADGPWEIAVYAITGDEP